MNIGHTADGPVPGSWMPSASIMSIAMALIACSVAAFWYLRMWNVFAETGGTADEGESTKGSGGPSHDQRIKTCYYTLLGNLERNCGADEIKVAYRKLALQLHPDKANLSGLSIDEATERFQEIQEAYATLSDPQARAWYDLHREEILKGHQGSNGHGKEETRETRRCSSRIVLSHYLDECCFRGFGDDPKGFFQVYNEIFAFINEEEANWDVDNSHETLPSLGYSKWDWQLVGSFYDRWTRFSSKKAFSFADKYQLRDAPNRQVRRTMEQENRKLRQAARCEFNMAVRELVQFVRRRDPRVKAHADWKAKEKAARVRCLVEELERRKATESQERVQRRLAARAEEEVKWKTYEEEKARRHRLGEEASSDEGEKAKRNGDILYCCWPCNKKYNSENAFGQHIRSKKHKVTLAYLGIVENGADRGEGKNVDLPQ